MLLKTLDLSKDRFEADGRKFFIEKEISINRFRKYEILEYELGTGTTWADCFRQDKQILALLNKGLPVDAGHIIHNRLNKVKHHLEDREHTALMVCALFINEKDEDRTVFDELVMKSKIDAWKKEYSVLGFFHLAVNLVRDFIPIYEEVLKSISEAEKKTVESLKSLADT